MAYKLKQSGDYRERRNYSMIKNSLELDDLLQNQIRNHKKDTCRKFNSRIKPRYFTLTFTALSSLNHKG